MFADYFFYTDEYCGSVIPSASAYVHNALFADEIISTLTMGHADRIEQGTPIYDKLKLAECAIADELYNAEQSNGVVSEHVGDHSKSYANPAQKQHEVMKKAAVFLRNTGLLYKGMC